MPTKKEPVKLKMEAIWWDKIYTKNLDGTETVVETKKTKNTIMDKLADFLAGLLLGESSFNVPTNTHGIGFHALGTGQVSWDSGGIPSPDKSNTVLDNEYWRQAPDIIEYIDDIGAVSISITNRIRVKTTFDYGDANGQWIREQAIFGGDANATLDTGHIVNIIRHAKIRKEDNIKLERYIQFNITITS